ncbi:MAG TPA: NAD-dependent epimerase/dehydratase family protein, partial [Kiritimatiellia bacterium]|nr:NAD-dependent epimerase/dehydratase family protein [Kiritimatiellia bacterium]
VGGGGGGLWGGERGGPETLGGGGGAFDWRIEASAEPSVLVGTKGGDAKFMVENNLVGSLHCFEWARERRVPVVFLSTSRVYPYERIDGLRFVEGETRFEVWGSGRGYSERGLDLEFPMEGARSLYGATKWASEILLQEYARQYDLPALINRCGVIAGPWQLGKVDQGVFTYWLVRHMAGKGLSYIGYGGTGKQVRDVLHVDDLVRLVLMQAERMGEFRGEVFPVGGSREVSLSLRETTGLCREITGREVEVVALMEPRPADVKWMMMDTGRTQEVFGWKPEHDARGILETTYRWLEANPEARELLGGSGR